MELHSARGSNGFGVSPLSYLDIQAWAEVTGVGQLLPYEMKTIKALDRALVGFYSSKAEGDKGKAHGR